MKFSVAFQEETYTINGSDSLHVILTSDTEADSTHQFTFQLTLSTNNAEYTQSWSTLLPNGSTSVSVPFVVPMEWANDNEVVDMNGYNGAITASLTVVYLLTVAGKQYTTTYKGYYSSIPVYVDASLMPTIGTLSYTSVDGKVPEDWDCLVQGISVVRVSAAQAAGIYGSEIYYYYFNGGTAQLQSYADISLQTAGDITIPVTVKDSRGRMTTADLYLVVQPYSAPMLTQTSSQRCDAEGTLAEEGEYFLASGSLAEYTVSGKNTVSVSVAWKKVTEADYGTDLAIDPTAGSIVDANLEEGASYDVRYTVQDAFYNIKLYDYLSSTVYLMHFLKGGSGIAVGKAAEQEGLFDVALDTTLRRDLTVGGDATITGDLVLGEIAVGEVLQSLQTPSQSQFTLNTEDFPLSNVTENYILRCGRMITYCFKGSIVSEEPTLAGQAYVIGTIPAGYYSTTHLPYLSGVLNGLTPCVVSVSSIGQVTVTLSESYQQTVWVQGVSIDVD
ncbi:MAG: hypothetical protein R3Y06_07675 [Faecalibacterium sp.]